MFTGIVEAVGRIVTIEPQASGRRVHIRGGALDLGDVRVGDSVAVNGVCLTVTDLSGDGFRADVSAETLAHTTFSTLTAGARVNLEKALAAGARLGGHLVSGHVDGVGMIVERASDGGSLRLTIEAPDGLAKYIARKGSICVDGVSLTVNAVHGARFELTIVPHTLIATALDDCAVGQRVNLEVDLIARYLERLLQGAER
ncbi:MAG: riboflavin synthase subunit alpha [Candidatus Muproteobacteria bacterium RBG_16_64_11]|uniref:Riboflavin synthase n=1 Tax=Candidatus Muproteobacteria bacterium RBG_16_64_11 TaxID=1817758 RepID=A0A1F6TI08_9PROT|nr:MAG: riboflavin synthase subunit alpha [Candidatus Muproteobacteria bacterium RBG_16_64_11]